MERNTARLTAQARLLAYPPLWCWEIVDHGTGTVLASSWETALEAYESPGEALRQATAELQKLTRSARGGRAGQRPPSPPFAMPA